jgi:nucleoside-diphosphate-sugar epimerase
MNRKTVLITGLASSLARSIAIQLNELGMQIFGTTSKQDYRCSLTEQIFTIDFRDQLDSLDKLNRYRFDVVIHVEGKRTSCKLTAVGH